jgi:HEAT repeat protein
MRTKESLFLCTILFISVLLSDVIFHQALAASNKEDFELLINKLQSPHAEQRAEAIATLGNMGPKAAPAIQLLIPMLEDRHTVKRRDGDYIVETNIMTEAKKALIKIGTASVPPLLEIFCNKNIYWVIRSNAAEILGALRDPRAIEPLIEFLKHKDDKSWDEYGFVADRTKIALEEITGQSYAKTGKNFGKDYAKWREWFDSIHNK